MPDTPLDDLRALRALLVDERRLSARTALEMRHPAVAASNWGHDVKRIQEQIDAIDRAIADEERPTPRRLTRRAPA